MSRLLQRAIRVLLVSIALTLHGCGLLSGMRTEPAPELALDPVVSTMPEAPKIALPRAATPPSIVSMPRTVPNAYPAHNAPSPNTVLPRSGRHYFQHDGPGELAPHALQTVPESTPRDEPLARAANQPYVVFGKTYAPAKERRTQIERGVASWYGRQFHGRKTATGDRYDMYAVSAAHPTLPLPSYVRVTNLENQRSIVVRVNDRGPFLQGRIIDLSYAAAAKLGFVHKGSTAVEVATIVPQKPTLALRATRD